MTQTGGAAGRGGAKRGAGGGGGLFPRRKHDARFPAHAVAYCLAEAGIPLPDADHVVFYDKPWIKFERMLETYLGFAPKGLSSFLASMPLWLKEKLNLKSVLRHELAEAGGCCAFGA